MSVHIKTDGGTLTWRRSVRRSLRTDLRLVAIAFRSPFHCTYILRDVDTRHYLAALISHMYIGLKTLWAYIETANTPHHHTCETTDANLSTQL